MRRKESDDAAIQVVEAILVAVLVAGALIFFALSNHPAPPVSSASAEGTLAAADALAVLQGSAPGNLTTDRLQLLVNAALNSSGLDDVGQVKGWRSNVSEVLPDGVHWSIRLFTGFGRLEILNSTSQALTPAREVAGAHAFVRLPSPNLGSAHPGDALGFTMDANCTLVFTGAGSGNITGPGAATPRLATAWRTLWLEGETNRTTIPDYAFFGRWSFSGGTCGTQNVDVGVATMASVLALPYSLELVVWNVY